MGLYSVTTRIVRTKENKANDERLGWGNGVQAARVRSLLSSQHNFFLLLNFRYLPENLESFFFAYRFPWWIGGVDAAC